MSKRYPGGIIRKTPQTPSQTSAQGIWDMASVTQAVKENTWPIAGVPDPISRSLRFRSSAQSYLSRTFGAPTDNEKWTYSVWIKRGSLAANRTIMSSNVDGAEYWDMRFNTSDQIYIQNRVGSSNLLLANTTAVYRDPSAWYHIVFVFDSNNATAANRNLLYVNGVNVALSANSGSSDASAWNVNSVQHNIGVSRTATSGGGIWAEYDGYETEIYFIDGQALTPSSFGSTNDQTGVWQPIAYTGTYGTNGFYLPFSNTASTSTLGNDFSGNSNNWTTNNISLTTGTSIQTFSTTGTTSWTAPAGVTSVSYLVVAGGGGGGGDANSTGGGGGGGGGYRTGTLSVTPGTAYTVTVGAGGAGGATGRGSNGSNSVFATITSTGGGGGGGSPFDTVGSGASGGSGGGGKQEQLGGAGTSGQGNAGGNSNSVYGAAGGGGAGGAAANTASGTNQPATAGGAGLSSSISGSSVSYAGGGGGGNGNGNSAANGTDGGGNGVNSGTGGDGTANRGGGGGGAGGAGATRNGGAGGSGIVILSWANGATTTYDSMVDVPTQWIPYNTAGDTGALYRGNYCVLNPIARGTLANGTITGGNLNLSTTTSDTRTYATMGFPTTGKYYYELTNNNSGSKGQGIASADDNGDTYQVLYFGDGNKRVDGTTTSYGASYTTNDVIGVAVDVDNNQITFYKNGISQGAISYTFSSKPTMFPYVRREASTDASYSFNFGQRPFAYAPPSGFLTLNTRNLPTPTIGATASTTANEYFDATTYTGTGSTQNITNSGSMQPDFVWIKNRSSTNSHQLTDSVRGVNLALASDLTIAEFTGNINAFNANGFQLTGATNAVNASGQTYVGWQWRASNATAVTNTNGSITSTVSANTSAGFSIVTYTGNGSTGTVGHGLGVAPNMIIIKNRSSAVNWIVYHSSLGNTKELVLNSTAAVDTNSDWNNTSPTSTVFSLGVSGSGNGSGNNLVAYCFAQIAGYSAFGSYTGNGSSDGPFIYTGFRPRFVMCKRTNTTGDWVINDTSRNPSNVMNLWLYPNVSDAETTFTFCDFVSNGFKIRAGPTALNNNGDSYIYMAFAESPFKFALAR